MWKPSGWASNPLPVSLRDWELVHQLAIENQRMTGASWCGENLILATDENPEWPRLIWIPRHVFKKAFDKDSEKIKNWHFGETSFGRPEIFLEVIRNHHVSTSNFSAICPSKRRELVRLRRDLPEHQSRGPQSCVFFWGWSGLVEFCFPWGIKKHRNIRWTWRNCFTSRVMVSKLIMSWYDNSPPCFSFGGQYSIVKSLISTCVLSYIGSREYWLLDRSQRVKKTH